MAVGEILFRLSSPGREMLLQTPRRDVLIDGAEANVATALARLGHDVGLANVVPDSDLGRSASATLRGHGVNTAAIRLLGDRMGFYFVSAGAGSRATEVVYDRTHSAFADAKAGDWSWSALLEGVDWFHLSGITSALGTEPMRAAIDGCRAAAERGIPYLLTAFSARSCGIAGR